VLVEKSHLVDVTNPLRNNQANPSDPNYTGYTGKIRAEDTIYTLNSTTFRGDTEDAGSPLVPVPAPLKPFSWNGFAGLPYSYTPDDPTTIAATIATYSGAGVVNWSKTNWFKTSY
jgi:pectate lyase